MFCTWHFFQPNNWTKVFMLSLSVWCIHSPLLYVDVSICHYCTFYVFIIANGFRVVFYVAFKWQDLFTYFPVDAQPQETKRLAVCPAEVVNRLVDHFLSFSFCFFLSFFSYLKKLNENQQSESSFWLNKQHILKIWHFPS